jgi:hypothetical protein
MRVVESKSIVIPAFPRSGAKLKDRLRKTAYFLCEEEQKFCFFPQIFPSFIYNVLLPQQID